MDRGHPLRLGLVLEADAASPTALREEARRAHERGLELLSVRDAPEEPGLDAWTLLAWLAGEVPELTLLALGLDAEQRPPAVLARAAASLDLLAGGRVELGLRGSAESLEEALAVVRGILDTSLEGPLVLEGERFELRGAQRGPATSRALPLWLEGPPELVGGFADGWITADPSQAQAEAVDAAARSAGRDEREVQRLAIVRGGASSEDWAAELTALVLEDGVSTILLEGAGPELAETFALEVAPALRAAVAVARAASGVRVGIPVPARVRARRRPGIDYESLPEGLEAVEPGDPRFGDLRSTYLRGGDPGLVLRPRDERELVRGLHFAREQRVPLSVRSGGHGISGRSTNDGGIVLDLARLDAVELIDPTRRLVRVGAGARWGEVAAALAPHGLAITSGDSGGVGVGGLASAGGIGWYAREHGLTIDRVRAVEAVLADGSLVRASATEHPELFWGMRGAGGNLALATSFEIEAHPAPPLGFAQLVFHAGDFAGFLERWGAVVEASPREVTSFLMAGRPRPGEPPVGQVMVAVDSSEPETVIGLLEPFAEIAPLLDQSVRIAPYSAIIAGPRGPHRGEGEPVARSSLVEHLTPQVARAAERVVLGGAAFFFQIRAVGGAVGDLAPEATAFAHRKAQFSLVGLGPSRARLDPAWDSLHELASGLYLSFETDPRPERLLDAFPPETLARLRAVKDRYDPENVFRDNFPVRG